MVREVRIHLESANTENAAAGRDVENTYVTWLRDFLVRINFPGAMAWKERGKITVVRTVAQSANLTG